MLRRKPRRWTTRLRIKLKSLTEQEADASRPFFMHPLIFLSGWVALGLLFGVQELVEMSTSNELSIPLWWPFASWGLNYLIWGLICLGLWHFLRESIQSASPR